MCIRNQNTIFFVSMNMKSYNYNKQVGLYFVSCPDIGIS